MVSAETRSSSEAKSNPTKSHPGGATKQVLMSLPRLSFPLTMQLPMTAISFRASFSESAIITLAGIFCRFGSELWLKQPSAQ